MNLIVTFRRDMGEKDAQIRYRPCFMRPRRSRRAAPLLWPRPPQEPAAAASPPPPVPPPRRLIRPAHRRAERQAVWGMDQVIDTEKIMRRLTEPLPATPPVRPARLISMPVLALAAVLCLALPAGGFAQDVGDDLHAAGQTVKQGARDTGHAIGEGARDVGQAIGEGASEAGHAVKEGARDTGHFAADKTREARSGIGGFFHRVGNWFSGG
jgi:hypothetical protein